MIALGASWEALGRLLGALGDALRIETLYFLKMNVLPRREHDFQNLYYQGTGSELKWERMLSRGMKRELEGGSQSKRDQQQNK